MPDSDKNYKPKEFYGSLKEASGLRHYHDFLWDIVAEIPLISLWDSCIGFARIMVYSGSIPDGIKDADLDSLYELSESNVSDLKLLMPIQQWLSDQLVKSICNKEIKPYLIGRFVDGIIDPKRTYVDSEHIKKWFICRGINIEENSGYELFSSEAIVYVEHIYNAILNVSQLLISGIYDPDFEIPANARPSSSPTPREDIYIILENTRLKQQIKQLPRNPNSPKTVHANAERFAINREQVLGAALSVIIQWPDQCQNSSGKYEARKIAKMIEEKSLLFWPETGTPHLSTERIEKLIREWVKKTGK